MTREANYRIVSDDPRYLLIDDLGPWDRYATITNAVESVVAELAPLLRGRRLFYFDSLGHLDEIVVEDGRFHHFAPGTAELPRRRGSVERRGRE
jgi:hypothetical protein